MVSNGLEEPAERTAEAILIELIDRLARATRIIPSDAESHYGEALASLIDALLYRCDNTSAPIHSNPADTLAVRLIEKAPQFSPDIIGRIYEHLRGFKLVLRPGREPALIPSARGKRNQGLFYTPPPVVGHIVRKTIEAVDLGDRPDLTRITVLDPAVGTGLFLLEALDRLTALAMETAHGSSRTTPDKITAMFLRRVAAHGLGTKPDEETALRVHILENCLYGVDMDPVAVRIARAAIKRRAFGEFPFLPDVRLNIRVGNSLIGAGRLDSLFVSRERENLNHFSVYFGKKTLEGTDADKWANSKAVFHWPLEFPEVFGSDADGFDAVIGNPPYEIVSAKESGIEERRREQSYFRKMYRTCRGKINTYRLMIERGLELLRSGGALGFIVPATLLADSTASRLREMLLDESNILLAITVPEKARIFDKVTQALLIFVTRKGQQTEAIAPITWDGKGPIPRTSEVSISRDLIRKSGSRIPLLKSAAEKELLEALAGHPTMRGNATVAPAARVHQGEINLTVHRDFTTDEATDLPLVRGEHIFTFRVEHPSPRGGRLDWLLPAFRECFPNSSDSTPGNPAPMATAAFRSNIRGRPWETERIGLGRVVNMETQRRLKAALVPAGHFLGDMTNYLTDLTVRPLYLLGLLNSGLLNWRIKVTSANNYISAAEIENLPIPRIPTALLKSEVCLSAARRIAVVAQEPVGSISECVEKICSAVHSERADIRFAVLVSTIELVVSEILSDNTKDVEGGNTNLMRWLDALVLVLYGVKSQDA